jgi:cation diffusion facilitator CzcD-associated flavoprotein CzcO
MTMMNVQQPTRHHDFLVVGAGVSGLYQLIRLRDLGADVAVIDGNDDLGGTWYQNRYPGCRFDSESYTYGYSFSQELLDEWDWTEHFAPQYETLRYLNHVAEKFDLRRSIQFGVRVVGAHFDDTDHCWSVQLDDGTTIRCRFLVAALGPLSIPTVPRYSGMDVFRGPSFHTFDWPHDPIDLRGKRVAVIGTGATGVQVISAIAEEVGELTVFQRRPNWCAPLGNRPITAKEMEAIRADYQRIFERCATTAGGFIHGTDPRSYFDTTRQERLEFWERVYSSPGFEKWVGNFREIFMDETANAEFSEFVAGKIRERVNDPEIANKLIPKDHGFGIQRVPLETRYYEAYNHAHVHLVDIEATPIVEIDATGILTSESHYDVDIIVYATGFDALTGPFDRIDFTGVGGRTLRDAWSDDPDTYLGVMVHGFPNLFIIAGPQGASSTINFPRSIEITVDWCTDLFAHALANGHTRIEATAEAQALWGVEVRRQYEKLLLRTARSWFTGYNENVDGHNRMRYMMYNGGLPRYRTELAKAAAANYSTLDFE